MLLVYIYVALASYNIEVLTLPLESIETVVDEAAQIAVVDSKGRIREGERRKRERRVREGRKGGNVKERDRRERREDRGGKGRGLNWREVWNEGTDAVMDVPLAGVCEVLYGERRDEDEDY
jgi:phosphatidylinositol glycan class P protein